MPNLRQKLNSLEKENEILTKKVDIIKTDFTLKEAKQIANEKQNEILEIKLKKKIQSL